VVFAGVYTSGIREQDIRLEASEDVTGTGRGEHVFLWLLLKPENAYVLSDYVLKGWWGYFKTMAQTFMFYRFSSIISAIR
jgi:hypothetical protein